jgi:hypothetical protein
MPEVENPGPDGGSQMFGSIKIRLDNSTGDDNELFLDLFILDQKNEIHPVEFMVRPDSDGNILNGRIEAGGSKDLEIQIQNGPYLQTGSKVFVLLNWTDKNNTIVSMRTPETEIIRVE